MGVLVLLEPTPPGVPSKLARLPPTRPTPISHQGHHSPQRCPAHRQSTSPAFKVPRPLLPLPLPSLLLSTCSPERTEPPECGEPISLLFEAFFDLLTMEY